MTSWRHPCSYRLYPHCIFPVKNNSIEVVYSSHVFEHLPLPTLNRVLTETHRTLKNNKDLIIKVPDYDRALKCWKKHDSSFVNLDWGFEGVIPLWKNKNVDDNLDYRSAMIFSSFWNEAYCNPFSSKTGNKTGAYFGPPIVSSEFLRELIQRRTPSQICSELLNIIKKEEKNFKVCHQLAWSQEEFKDLLEKANFEVVTFDSDEIITKFEQVIPVVQNQKAESVYCWEKKLRVKLNFDTAEENSCCICFCYSIWEISSPMFYISIEVLKEE